MRDDAAGRLERFRIARPRETKQYRSADRPENGSDPANLGVEDATWLRPGGKAWHARRVWNGDPNCNSSGRDLRQAL